MSVCVVSCTVCNSSLDEDPLPSSPSLKGAMARAGDNEVITGQHTPSRTFDMKYSRYCVMSTDQDPSAWQTLRGQFIGIQAFTTSSACKHSPRGVSPSAHLGDGCVDLLLVHRCSRLNYLRLLRRVKSGGDQVSEIVLALESQTVTDVERNGHGFQGYLIVFVCFELFSLACRLWMYIEWRKSVYGLWKMRHMVVSQKLPRQENMSMTQGHRDAAIKVCGTLMVRWSTNQKSKSGKK